MSLALSIGSFRPGVPAMSVRVQLDNPHTFYTNLDFISGKIVLNLLTDETISAIVVKLEGESRTVLIKPPMPHEQRRREDRSRIAMENHKILYRLQTVFPSVSTTTPTAKASFTLGAGQHEYPFRFKIPFNTMCGDQNMQAVGVGLGGRLGLMEMPMLQSHIRKPLPPSLGGFPGEAEIRYFVKVTVQRPSIWKENRRNEIGFKFMPIERPRPPSSNAEAFARRPYAFQASSMSNGKKRGMFARQPTALSPLAPSILVDARLPSPSILVCRKPVPLRIIVKKQNDSPEYTFLVGLHIDLIAKTEVRAQDVMREELSTFPIVNLQGLSIAIGDPSNPVGTETAINDNLWDRVPLPPTVTPSFHICNLTRTYELQPQKQIIPLRFPVEVYSGVTPSPALLNALANRTATTSASASASTSAPYVAPAVPPRPSGAPAAPPIDPLYPPQMGTPNAELMGDAPPSYEDAMADDIGPLDGRREYSGVSNEDSPSEVGGEKGGRGAVPGYSAQEGRGGGASGSGSGRGGFVA
ncbi:hypothetical protein VE03_05803 [Pseudogymnoascus sp. 23342-1-I1]|nr:hypothetical protein VE03_05803 [Pseudogymnoascus sp. 23342-1-I1]